MTPNAAYALAGIGAVLASATGIAGALRLLAPRLADRELWLRLRSWWLMIAVFAVAVSFGAATSIAFSALVSVFAFREFVSIVPFRACDRPAIFAGYLVIPLHYAAIAMGASPFVVPAAAFVAITTFLVLRGETRGFLRSAALLQLGLAWTVYALGHLASLLLLPEGVSLFVFAVALTEANDVAQFVWGKTFGGPRITRVSPNKTWAGFLGGVFTTALLAASTAPLLTPLAPHEGAIAGALLAVAGFVGDLTMSALKRDLKLKDTGTILPGHGGVLDRADSLVLAGPAFFYFVTTV
jgi:phosphatidate cytidylyltransferase